MASKRLCTWAQQWQYFSNFIPWLQRVALWTLTIRIIIENQNIHIFYALGSCLNTSWCSTNLSFVMLKSKSNSMKTEILFSIFVIFWPKLRENIDFLPNYRNLQKSTIIQLYLLLFWRLLSKNYLSSIAFSQLMAPVL